MVGASAITEFGVYVASLAVSAARPICTPGYSSIRSPSPNARDCWGGSGIRSVSTIDPPGRMPEPLVLVSVTTTSPPRPRSNRTWLRLIQRRASSLSHWPSVTPPGPSGARPTATGSASVSTNRFRTSPPIRTASTSLRGRCPASERRLPCRGQVGAPVRNVGGGCSDGVRSIAARSAKAPPPPPPPNSAQPGSGQRHCRESSLTPAGERVPATGSWPPPTCAMKTGPPAPGTGASTRPAWPSHGYRPTSPSSRARVSTGRPSRSATSSIRSPGWSSTSTRPSSAQRRTTIRSLEVRSASDSSARCTIA